MFHRSSYCICRCGIAQNAVPEATHKWIKRKSFSSCKKVTYLQVARSQRRARFTKTSYCLYSTGCSAQSNKNTPLLVKDLFTEHVHSRFVIWAPLYRTIYINSTFKIQWHESYCEYLAIRKELDVVVYRPGIIISKIQGHNCNNFKLLCSTYCLKNKTGGTFWRIKQQ